MVSFSGKSSTVFAPNASVTTAEAAKMLLVYSGHDVQKDGLTGAQWKENTLKLADAERSFDLCNYKAG